MAGGPESCTIPTLRPRATPVPSLGLIHKMGRLVQKMARAPASVHVPCFYIEAR